MDGLHRRNQRADMPYIYASKVFSVAEDHINELINSNVFTNQNIRIKYFYENSKRYHPHFFLRLHTISTYYSRAIYVVPSSRLSL
jgi:hypothetical protein